MLRDIDALCADILKDHRNHPSHGIEAEEAAKEIAEKAASGLRKLESEVEEHEIQVRRARSPSAELSKGLESSAQPAERQRIHSSLQKTQPSFGR